MNMIQSHENIWIQCFCIVQFGRYLIPMKEEIEELTTQDRRKLGGRDAMPRAAKSSFWRWCYVFSTSWTLSLTYWQTFLRAHLDKCEETESLRTIRKINNDDFHLYRTSKCLALGESWIFRPTTIAGHFEIAKHFAR